MQQDRGTRTEAGRTCLPRPYQTMFLRHPSNLSALLFWATQAPPPPHVAGTTRRVYRVREPDGNTIGRSVHMAGGMTQMVLQGI